MSVSRFIVVEELDGSKKVELELEPTKEAPLLLSTLQAQFPSATSLEYRHVVGGATRGLRVGKEEICQPADGWKNRVYNPVYPEGNKKRKRDEDCVCKSLKRHCQELYVYGFPWYFDDAKLKSYFSQFGEVVSAMVTRKRDGKIGFVRFDNFKSQLEVLSMSHVIEGRHICVSMSDRDRNSHERGKSSAKPHSKPSGTDRYRSRTHSARTVSPAPTASMLANSSYRPDPNSFPSQAPMTYGTGIDPRYDYALAMLQAMAAGSSQMSSAWSQSQSPPGSDVVGDVNVMTTGHRADSSGPQRQGR